MKKIFGWIFLILGLISFTGIFFVDHYGTAIMAVICFFAAKLAFTAHRQQMYH